MQLKEMSSESEEEQMEVEEEEEDGHTEGQTIIEKEVSPALDEEISQEMESTAQIPQLPPQVDLSQFTELIQLLESSSGHSLLKIVITNSKELCKIAPYRMQIIQKVAKRVSKCCTKCISKPGKKEKFFQEIAPSLSCEDDLFKTFLKNGMKSSENKESGASLISIARSLLSVLGSEGKVINPILGIQMLLSHSKAEEIFLEHMNLKGKYKAKTEADSLEEELNLLNGNITQSQQPKEEKPKASFSIIKTELLKLWLTLVQSFCKVSKVTGTENDKKILENSIPYLMQMYNASLGSSDRQIFSILKLYASKKLKISLEAMPLFGPKCFDAASSAQANPLYAHSIRANTVLGLINDVKAFETAMNFDITDVEDEEKNLEEYYDIRFLLPLVCHCLDEKNICDVVKVMTNGWLYFIMRGMALEDSVLRNVAFLAYKRLIFNLQLAKGFRLQDVKIWLHFLVGVKKGLTALGECKLSTLLSVWMVSTCEILKSPCHPMYPRITHFLLAKPTIDLTVLPDFIPFFNAVDGNKESREWILNILVRGLQSKADWTIARKLPTIKYLCSSFSLEKIGTQRIILNILAKGAKIPEVAHDMVDRHSLLLWISNVPLGDKLTYRRELEDIYKNLSEACPAGFHRDSVFKFVALKHKWEYVRGNSEAVVPTINDCEESMLDVSSV